MSEKKRKSTAVQVERPPKRPAHGQPKSKLQIDFLTGSDVAKPVIAVTPGASLPPNLEFQSFVKKLPDGSSNLLLHSSTHPTIDFKGTEADSNTEKYLKHYVAVFDPSANRLQVTEVKRLTVRSCVRTREQQVDSDEDAENAKPVTNYLSRTALTHAFGTKKSRKAVQASADNRLLTQGGNESKNPLSDAILSSMPSPELSEDIPASSRAHKPLPEPNLLTSDINEVYPMSSVVVPNSSLLDDMPLSYWRETFKRGGAISSQSRFVASRVSYLVTALEADPKNTIMLQKVQLLRYILLLIELHTYLSRLPRGKKIPPVLTWPPETISGNIRLDVLTQIYKHFAPDGSALGKHRTTLLQSTILALTLHIPPPSLNAGANVLVSETHEIQLDLAMNLDDVKKLYKELGCRIESANPGELERWGLKIKDTKAKKKEGEKSAVKPRFAKLSFPIKFPTITSGRPQQRRR